MDAVTAGPSHPGAPLPQPLRRAREGRWLGGVCRGMANRWATPVAQLRALFVVAGLFGGLGLLAYAACWLVLPSDADDESPSLLRGVASVALLVAALAALATLAAAAAAATLFGFGWAVLFGLAAFFAGALVVLPATRPAWVLLPLVAVALPAVVVAASEVRLHPQAGLQTVRPLTAAEIPAGGYRAGLGELFVDLRGLRAPRDAVVPLKLDTGLGRTVVALPPDRCFDVEVDYATGTVGWDAVRSAVERVRSRSTFRPAPLVLLYGRPQPGRSGSWRRRSDDPHAPTLRVSYTSLGGELWLRDYPNGIGPLYQVDWPYGDPAVIDEASLAERMRGACAPGARRRALQRRGERRRRPAAERMVARPAVPSERVAKAKPAGRGSAR